MLRSAQEPTRALQSTAQVSHDAEKEVSSRSSRMVMCRDRHLIMTRSRVFMACYCLVIGIAGLAL